MGTGFTGRFLGLIAAFATGMAIMARLPATPSAQAAIDSPSGTPATMRSPDGLYYIDAVVNGRPIHFLVDTGATAMMLSAADARMIGIDKRLRFNRTVETAAGPVPIAWTKLGHVALAGRRFEDISVGVLPHGGMSLLGQDILARFDTVSMSGGELHLE